MKLTLNAQNELLDESGKIIGPLFDSIANRPDIVRIPDVQRAFEARLAEIFADHAAALSDAKLAADKRLAHALTQVTAAKAEKQAAQAALAKLQTHVDTGIAAIKAAVEDPNTPTESTVLKIIADATKSDRDKRLEELDAAQEKIAQEREQLLAVDGAQPNP